MISLSEAKPRTSKRYSNFQLLVLGHLHIRPTDIILTGVIEIPRGDDFVSCCEKIREGLKRAFAHYYGKDIDKIFEKTGSKIWYTLFLENKTTKNITKKMKSWLHAHIHIVLNTRDDGLKVLLLQYLDLFLRAIHPELGCKMEFANNSEAVVNYVIKQQNDGFSEFFDIDTITGTAVKKNFYEKRGYKKKVLDDGAVVWTKHNKPDVSAGYYIENDKKMTANPSVNRAEIAKYDMAEVKSKERRLKKLKIHSATVVIDRKCKIKLGSRVLKRVQFDSNPYKIINNTIIVGALGPALDYNTAIATSFIRFDTC